MNKMVEKSNKDILTCKVCGANRTGANAYGRIVHHVFSTHPEELVAAIRHNVNCKPHEQTKLWVRKIKS
jgi:hypothetical protein